MERVRKVLINVCWPRLLIPPWVSCLVQKVLPVVSQVHVLYYHQQYGLQYEASVMCPGHLAITDPTP